MSLSADTSLSATIVESLNWRYATKIFDTSKPVSEADLQTILEAARLAPTSQGLQPFHITVVTKPETKSALRKAAFNQPQLESASHVLVFSAVPNIQPNADKMVAALRQGKVPEDKIALMSKYVKIGKVMRTVTMSTKSWAAKQTYIALGFALATAAQLRVDACPMEGFSSGKFAKILGLPTGEIPVALMTLGYRAADDTVHPKYRLPIDALTSLR